MTKENKVKEEKTKTKTKETKKLSKHDIMFDEQYVKDLLDDEQIETVKAYVKKFFFRYKKEIFKYDGATYDLYSQLDAIKLIPNDLVITTMKPNPTTKKFEEDVFSVAKYLKSTDFMKDSYKPVIDFTKPLIFSEKKIIRGVEFEEKYLNMAKPLNVDKYASPVIMTDYIKEALQTIDNHIKEIICSNDEKCYQFTKNFIACTFGGRKLRKCLYWQSSERTGKGIIMNGLLKGILGDAMYKTSSVETICKYTKPLEGCLLINPDELPVDGSNWKSLSDDLKSKITEPEFDSRTMHQTAYPIKNTFNLIITTNNNAITLTQTNHSRYHINKISESRLGDKEYFMKVTKAVNDSTVRLAYYQQMMTHFQTLSKWNEDDDEATTAKLEKMIEALPKFHKYIKEHYVLRGLGIDIRTNKFFDLYYETTKDTSSKQQIGKYLHSMGIEPIKVAQTKTTNQHYVYRISKQDLYNVFVTKKWIDLNVDHVFNREEIDDDEEEIGLVSVELAHKPTLDEQIEHYTKLLESFKQQKVKELEAEKNKPVKQPKPKTGIDKYAVVDEIEEKLKKPKKVVVKEIEEKPKKAVKKVVNKADNDESSDDEEYEKFASTFL